MGGAVSEIEKCTAKYCPLWPYRRGNPKVGSEEEEQARLMGSFSLVNMGTKHMIETALERARDEGA